MARRRLSGRGQSAGYGSAWGFSHLGAVSEHPQAYLDYASEDWDPPARWDEGIPGLLFDYNVNVQTQHQLQTGSRGYSASGNGVAGANLGAWRLRADWQGNLNHQTGSGQSTDKQLTGVVTTPTGRSRR